MRAPRSRDDMISDIFEFLRKGREVETRILTYTRLQSGPGKKLLQELVSKGLLESWGDRSPYSNRPCTMYQLAPQSEEEVIEAVSTTR